MTRSIPPLPPLPSLTMNPVAKRGQGLDSPGSWTFLTNHAHVLVCLAHDPGIRTRDIAERVGITERAAQRIVADLVRAGYVERTRVGRRNRYTVDGELPLRHPLEEHGEIGALLRVLAR